MWVSWDELISKFHVGAKEDAGLGDFAEALRG
jgi:hypothetical protein